MNIAIGTVASATALASSSALAPAMPDAALARLEQAIEALRTCFVCEGWHPNGLDEAAAARAVAYFRAGCPEESDADFAERDAAMEFIFSHGQSLDWIIEGDPLGLVCRAARHSARAQSVLALAPPDPVFALIERHRVADAYWDTLNHEDDEAKYDAAGDAACALAGVLGQTQPTTLAGVLAIMRYRREHDVAFPGHHLFIPEGSEGENTPPGRRMTNWLATIEQAIAAIAGVDKPSAASPVPALVAAEASEPTKIGKLFAEWEAVRREYKEAKKVRTKLEGELKRRMPKPDSSIVYSPKNDLDGLQYCSPEREPHTLNHYIWSGDIERALAKIANEGAMPVPVESNGDSGDSWESRFRIVHIIDGIQVWPVTDEMRALLRTQNEPRRARLAARLELSKKYERKIKRVSNSRNLPGRQPDIIAKARGGPRLPRASRA